MQKKIILIMTICSLMMMAVLQSHATIMEQNDSQGHVVFDDIADQIWYWDLHYFAGNKTYGEQRDLIDDLNSFGDSGYYGYENWRMAVLEDMKKLWENGVENITDVFGASSKLYPGNWIGRYDMKVGSMSHRITWLTIPISDSHTDLLDNRDWILDNADDFEYLGAWAVAERVNPVPEPTTFVLLTTGLIGLLGFKNRRKNM